MKLNIQICKHHFQKLKNVTRFYFEEELQYRIQSRFNENTNILGAFSIQSNV